MCECTQPFSAATETVETAQVIIHYFDWVTESQNSQGSQPQLLPWEGDGIAYSGYHQASERKEGY